MADKNPQRRSKSVSLRRRLAPLLVVLLIGGGIWVWEDVIKYRVIPKRFGVVKDGLVYRSGRLSAALVKRTLAKYGIRKVVDLTHNEPDNRDQQAEKKAAAELGIEIMRFTLRGDGTGDIKNYARAIAAIVEAERANEPILVHCAAGAQRTGGVIAAYRLLVQKESPSFVLDELARYGWDPEDDTIVLTYLNSHMGELAGMLKQMSIIDNIPSPLPVLRRD